MANDKHGTLTANLCDEVTKVTNPVKIQDLTFRDGHQSLFATRGRTEDFLPIAEDMDQVGFYSMEVWGGATFDTMHRFLGEDPWERIRTMAINSSPCAPTAPACANSRTRRASSPIQIAASTWSCPARSTSRAGCGERRPARG